MAFVNSGEASTAVSAHLSQYQSFADFLKAMLEAAQKELEAAKSKQEQSEADPNSPDNSSEPQHPFLAELDQVKEAERQQAATDISALVSYELAQSNGLGKDGEFYYQSEAYTVYTLTAEDSTIPTYHVVDADMKQVLMFQMVDEKVHVLEDNLSPQDKLNFIGPADNLHREGIDKIMAYPDANDRFSRLGELAPAGTRATWVTQQILKDREAHPPLGQESTNRYQFERQATGECTVTDKTQGQILQIPQLGAASSTMSREHLDNFKEIHSQMYSQQQSVKQSSMTQSAQSTQSKGQGKSSGNTQNTQKSASSAGKSMGGR